MFIVDVLAYSFKHNIEGDNEKYQNWQIIVIGFFNTRDGNYWINVIVTFTNEHH